jgi:DNA-binding transcriptional LysR family regulator
MEAAYPARPAWPGVELRHLVAFQAVVAAGSFIAAARHLGYTQSGISAQIRALERLVGARLIDRSRGARGIALTEEGLIFMRYAREIAAKFEAAADHLGTGQRVARRVLRIGAFRSASLGIAAPALASLADADPELQVDLVENEDQDVLLELLEEGEVELAFVTAPVRKGFDSIVLLQERVVAVVAATSERADREALRLSDLAGWPVIVDDTGHGSMLAHAAVDGGALRATAVADHTVAIALALAGFGVALLPELSVLPAVGAAVLPLVADLPGRAIALARVAGRERSDEAALFSAAVTAVTFRSAAA